MGRSKLGSSSRLCSTSSNLFIFLSCCIFQPAFGCYALQRLVKICFFDFFCTNKLKQAIISLQEMAEKGLSMKQIYAFYSKKNHIFSGKNTFLHTKSCIYLGRCQCCFLGATLSHHYCSKCLSKGTFKH